MLKDELIAALEAATGPDRELDWLIAVATGHKQAKDKPGMWAGVDQMAYVQDLPRYTARIDAALALRPAGWAYGTGNGSNGAWAWVASDDEKTWVAPEDLHNASTPALAICIAALRATERGEAGR